MNTLYGLKYNILFVACLITSNKSDVMWPSEKNFMDFVSGRVP